MIITLTPAYLAQNPVAPAAGSIGRSGTNNSSPQPPCSCRHPSPQDGVAASAQQHDYSSSSGATPQHGDCSQSHSYCIDMAHQATAAHQQATAAAISARCWQAQSPQQGLLSPIPLPLLLLVRVVLLSLLLAAAPSSAARELQGVSVGFPVDINDTLLPKPSALTTPCGATVLSEFSGCCSDQEELRRAGAGLSGTLPADFTPARGTTDFSDNPALCGSITQLHPDMSSRPNMTADFLKLFNSQVQLDMRGLSSQSFWLGPVVAKGLGVGTLAFNNLKGRLNADQAYQTCLFLAAGNLTVLRADYCSPQKDPSCSCRASPGLRVFARFRDQAEWDACHQSVLQLSFDSVQHQAVALAQYTEQMSQTEVAYACGEAGERFRRVLGVVIIVAVMAVVGAERLARCFFHTCSGGGSCCWHIDPDRKRALQIVWFCCVHIFDICTDWYYIWSVARAGNTEALLMLGWLMMLAPSALFLVLLVSMVHKCRTQKLPIKVTLSKGMVAALVLFQLRMAVVLPFLLAGSINLLRFASGSILSPDDCLCITALFTAGALLVHGTLLLAFVWHKYRCMGPDSGSQFAKLRMLSAIVFLTSEDVPQIIIQAYLWVEGHSMVSTAAYCLSAVSSCLGPCCLSAIFSRHGRRAEQAK